MHYLIFSFWFISLCLIDPLSPPAVSQERVAPGNKILPVQAGFTSVPKHTTFWRPWSCSADPGVWQLRLPGAPKPSPSPSSLPGPAYHRPHQSLSASSLLLPSHSNMVLLLSPCTGAFLPGRARQSVQVQTNRSLFLKAGPRCHLQRIPARASWSPRFTGLLPSHMEVSELPSSRLLCCH